MPAYVIAIRKSPVKDEDAMAQYREHSRKVVENSKMIPRVVYGPMEALEGTLPDGVVMLEFPTMEDAKAWYHSDGYQTAAPFRQKAADYDMFIVDGMG